MEETRLNGMEVDSGIIASSILSLGKISKENHYKVEAYRPGKMLRDSRGRYSGREMVHLFTEEFDNLVVDAGLNDSLDKHLKGSGYTAAWYVGVTGATPVFAAADTMSSHAGWTESTTYDEANRPTLTLGTVANKSVDNSANKAVFTISGTVTLGGAFVVTTNNKGGSTGILYGGGAFSQNRSLIDNDILNVTITCTAAPS